MREEVLRRVLARQNTGAETGFTRMVLSTKAITDDNIRQEHREDALIGFGVRADRDVPPLPTAYPVYSKRSRFTLPPVTSADRGADRAGIDFLARVEARSATSYGSVPRSDFDHKTFAGYEDIVESKILLNAISRFSHHVSVSRDKSLSPPSRVSYTFYAQSYAYFLLGEDDGVFTLSSGESISHRSVPHGSRYKRIIFANGFTIRDGDFLSYSGSGVVMADVVVRDDSGEHPFVFGALKDGENYDSIEVTGTSASLVADTFSVDVGDRIVVATPTDLPYSLGFVTKDGDFEVLLGVGVEGKNSWAPEPVFFHGRYWDVWSSFVIQEKTDVTVTIYLGDSL